MFFKLAGHSTDLEDVYHYVKKVRLSSDAQANCMNILVGVCTLCTTMFYNDQSAKLVKKIYLYLLNLMKLVTFFSLNFHFCI
jgi:hypothetical protein